MFPDHQQSVVGIRKRKRRTKKEKPLKLPKEPKIRKPRLSNATSTAPPTPQIEQPEPGEIHPSQLNRYAFGDTLAFNDDDEEEDFYEEEVEDEYEPGNSSMPQPSSSKRGRKPRSFMEARTPEAMAARRKRVWQLMAKKELGRCQRAKVNNHKETVQNAKRVAVMCSKVVRQRAMYSQKVMKETIWRAKRLTREMLSYWKRYERIERDAKRRMEKEAEEQRKMDVELIEAKRQQRKLNFLITQTELYAHFMSKKLGKGTEEEQLRILNQLDEEANPRLAAYDDYDAEEMKLKVQQNAEKAFQVEKAKSMKFDVAAEMKQQMAAAEANAIKMETEIKSELEAEMEKTSVLQEIKADLPQPSLFKGTLKAYQIKGIYLQMQ